MLFLHPMWDNESERIGKQRCTPVGYALHVIAELTGFVGLLVLFGTSIALTRLVFYGTFSLFDLWLLAIPFGMGVASEVLIQFSWWLALRRGFRYDPERRESSWLVSGERRTYKFPA